MSNIAPTAEREAGAATANHGAITDGVRGPYFAKRVPWLGVRAIDYRDAHHIVLIDPAARPGMWQRISARSPSGCAIEGPEAGARIRPLWEFGVRLCLYPKSLTLAVTAPPARERKVGWDGAEIETMSVRAVILPVLHEAVATQRAALKSIARGHAFKPSGANA